MTDIENINKSRNSITKAQSDIYEEDNNEADNKEEFEKNVSNIKEDDSQENEMIEYLLPSIEHKIIDSIVSSKNFFLNHLTKKVPDSNNLIEIRTKLAINDEYKDALTNEKIRSNIYSDKLSFRNKKQEVITSDQINILKPALMLNSEQQIKEDNLLKNKMKREEIKVSNTDTKNEDVIITNTENYSKTISSTTTNLYNNNYTINKQIKSAHIAEANRNLPGSTTTSSALVNIPEKYRAKEFTDSKLNDSLIQIAKDLNIDKGTSLALTEPSNSSTDNSNLFLSLYRNKNYVCFRKNKLVTPEWHAPWKLYRVISGHNGWVRCIDVDPTNNWFVTGSNDRVIKFWDLASGKLKLSLTGHINTVRAVVVSNRHPYLFSCGEDKQVKCWDLEQNKVVRHYHGHLSGVHTLTLHPTLDVIISGGRDCVGRVWDIRSKQQIMCLEGHNNTVSTIVSQEYTPQVITGSHDSTIKLWDLGTGRCMNTLTHHKKSIRSIFIHETEYSFVSGKLFI